MVEAASRSRRSRSDSSGRGATVAHAADNGAVDGSNPSVRTAGAGFPISVLPTAPRGRVAQSIERSAHNRMGAGLNPVVPISTSHWSHAWRLKPERGPFVVDGWRSAPSGQRQQAQTLPGIASSDVRIVPTAVIDYWVGHRRCTISGPEAKPRRSRRLLTARVRVQIPSGPLLSYVTPRSRGNVFVPSRSIDSYG